MDTPMGEPSPQEPVSAPSQPVAPAPAMMPEEKKTNWISLLLWIVILAVVVYGVIWYFFLR